MEWPVPMTSVPVRMSWSARATRAADSDGRRGLGCWSCGCGEHSIAGV